MLYGVPAEIKIHHLSNKRLEFNPSTYFDRRMAQFTYQVTNPRV
jgi:hypothetical protein